MKKSYNPFTMWGSYIGAIIGYIYSSGIYNYFIKKEVSIASGFFFENMLVIMFGFLIGWGINSLIRRYK